MTNVNTNWAKPVKVSNQGYSWVHVAAHGISIGYDFSMALYYNNLLERIEKSPGYATDEIIQPIKDERLKHTISGALKGVELIIFAVSCLQNNESDKRK